MFLSSTSSFILIVWCLQLFGSCVLLCRSLFEPTAMPQRLWEDYARPDWSKQQAARLEEAHFQQLSLDEEWEKKQGKQPTWWEQWNDSWRWDWKSHSWTRSNWSWWSGWKWDESGGWSREPTTTKMQTASSTSWEEDKDPKMITTSRVHEDMSSHRMKAITPLSFQPQRHITMILGRPVLVLLWPKIHSTM